jgi:hypothetical protein
MECVVKDLTYICAYFENPGMLREQQAIWAAYPANLRKRFHVIVTDDCSPTFPARDVFKSSGIASQRLFRAGVHRRWDWLFCRNLGAEQASTEWILLTDIDHALPAESLDSLLSKDLNPMTAYRFCRVDAPRPWPYALTDCPPYKKHNDSWLMTRELFFHPKIGGYDERLSGCYGSSSDFTGRVQIATGHTDLMLPETLIRYPREIIADASTLPSTYTRKGDKENDLELDRRKNERAKTSGWRPKRLTIPYTLEATC